MERSRTLIKTLWTIGLALLVAVAFGACAGGGDSSESAGNSDAGTVAQAEPTNTPADTPPADDTAGEMDTPTETNETPDVPPEKYAMEYDPNAYYTLDDINMSGSYLKISFDGLTDDQVNRAIHRLRTEFCTCGCVNDPIDQCLVNDPTCPTAPTLAKQIIREEKTKG